MFNFDFTTGTNNFSQPPAGEGVYHVKLTNVDSYTTQSGNARISLTATVMDGDSEGCTIRDGINIPKSSDDKVKGVWMRFFTAMGLSPMEIKGAFSGANLSMDDVVEALKETVEGLTGYCYYAPAVEEGGWPTRKWLTPAQAKSSRNTSNGASSSDSSLGEFINI